jgi:hypothetical protein
LRQLDHGAFGGLQEFGIAAVGIDAGEGAAGVHIVAAASR